MFLIRITNEANFIRAKEMLDAYDCPYRISLEGDYTWITALPVADDSLPELYFSGNWGALSERLCKSCQDEIARKGVGHDVCGHLTFTGPKHYTF